MYISLLLLGLFFGVQNIASLTMVISILTLIGLSMQDVRFVDLLLFGVLGVVGFC